MAREVGQGLELCWLERYEGSAGEGFAPGVGESVEGVGGLVVLPRES